MITIEPTVEEEVLGTTHHCKKTINFLIDDERKEIDVTIWYDETSGEGGREQEANIVSIQIGVVYAWNRGEETDMGLRINETITGEVEKMFADCDFTQEAQNKVAEAIEEKVDDILCEIG
jgi:hypothetical protein